MEYKVKYFDIARLVVVALLFTLEFLLITYWNADFGALRSALLLFLCSIGIGIVGLSFSFKKERIHKLSLTESKWLKIIGSTLVAILGGYTIHSLLNEIFSEFVVNKIDVSESDVIPQIMYMVERLFEGSFAYDPINDWGYQLNPTYLPLQWLPFSLAEIFNIDYRWIPYAFLCLSILFYQKMILFRIENILLLFLLSALPWVMWYHVISDEPKVFAYTIESLICAYYLFLGTSLCKKNPYMIGLAISLCLLSRFSLILWLPLFGFVLLWGDNKHLIKIIGVVLFALLAIYIVPFLSKDIQIFTNGLAHHTKAAVGEWQPYWQEPGEKPYHLFRGVGLAGFFYDWVDGDVLSRIKVLQAWHVGSIIVSIFTFMVFYLFKRKNINTSIFLVASLKIYFCFFYYFIQIPYIYLMMIPLFFTLVLFFKVIELSHGSAEDKS